MSSFSTTVDAYTTGNPPIIPGVVMAAISSDGTPIFARSAGRTSVGLDALQITPSNTFRLASVTKLITTVSALQLVDRRIMSLDDPSLITQHLPELVSQPVICSSAGQDEDTLFSLEKREKDITLRMLLTHSSGVGYDLIDPLLQAWRKSRDEPWLTLSGRTLEAFSTPLVYQPGTSWAYGGGLDWAGVLIERLTGLSLGEYMKKKVFEPLGMERTTFKVQQNEVVKKALVQATMRMPEGGLAEMTTWNDDMEGEGGGGGLYGSVDDVMAVLQDLVSEQPKLLSKEMVEMMFEPQFEEGSPQLAGLKDSAIVFEPWSGILTKGVKVNHGLGGLLVLGDSEKLGKTKGTLIWAGALNCPWFANREQGVAAFYASQMFPPGEPKSVDLFEGFTNEVWRLVAKREKLLKMAKGCWTGSGKLTI